MDERTAYPDSSRRSEQLSCRKHFSFELRINFYEFSKIKAFSGIINLTELTEKENDISIVWG